MIIVLLRVLSVHTSSKAHRTIQDFAIKIAYVWLVLHMSMSMYVVAATFTFM